MRTPETKPTPVEYPVEEFISNRWSPRAFDPNRPVTTEDVARLFEAARWAPSSYNEQPWRYLVFDGRDGDARRDAEACLMEGNAWARQAPVLLLGVARETHSHNGKPNRHAAHDLGAASMALVLQAAALGLVTHQMGGFDSVRARTSFRIPDGFEPYTMIAVGYPGDVEALPAALQAHETAPRTRKPQQEFVHYGRWPESD